MRQLTSPATGNPRAARLTAKRGLRAVFRSAIARILFQPLPIHANDMLTFANEYHH
jgi:hypothetical protein